jgi:GNAT superfamily N-acetyltransferase
VAIELSPDRIDAYRAYFSGPHAELVAASIAEGNTAAQLWTTSQPDAPPALLLWDKGNNVFYLAGKLAAAAAQRELADLLRTSIRPRALHERLTHFKVRALPASDEAALAMLFEGVALSEISVVFYSFTRAQPPAPPTPEGVQLTPIDRALLTCADLENLEPVRAEIRWMWPSEQRFYERGLGAAALAGRRVICWCTAEYVSAARCGVGIETEPQYTRRGVATATAAYFVQLCRRRGLTPYWESRSSNLPSIRVAENVGFERLAEERYWLGAFEA